MAPPVCVWNNVASRIPEFPEMLLLLCSETIYLEQEQLALMQLGVLLPMLVIVRKVLCGGGGGFSANPCRIVEFFCMPSLSNQWYSTFSVTVPPPVIPLQLCTPKVLGV
jgi:hypothetical protein